MQSYMYVLKKETEICVVSCAKAVLTIFAPFAIAIMYGSSNVESSQLRLKSDKEPLAPQEDWRKKGSHELAPLFVDKHILQRLRETVSLCAPYSTTTCTHFSLRFSHTHTPQKAPLYTQKKSIEALVKPKHNKCVQLVCFGVSVFRCYQQFLIILIKH